MRINGNSTRQRTICYGTDVLPTFQTVNVTMGYNSLEPYLLPRRLRNDTTGTTDGQPLSLQRGFVEMVEQKRLMKYIYGVDWTSAWAAMNKLIKAAETNGCRQVNAQYQFNQVLKMFIIR